jgi:hypothetical protein
VLIFLLLDFFIYKVKDRVLFSGEVGFDEMTQRQTGWKVLLANNITV